MKLKEAIKEAKKRKKMLKSKKLSMYQQEAKLLVYWLFIDSKDPANTLKEWLETDDWELED